MGQRKQEGCLQRFFKQVGLQQKGWHVRVGYQPGSTSQAHKLY